MTDCPVCRGSRFVRLPLYHPVDLAAESVPPTIDEPYRVIACPDCTDQVPFNRLYVLKEVSSIFDERQIRDTLARDAAHRMVDRILIDGLMKVEKIPTTSGYQFRCTMGVVAPNHVATFEERVAQRQLEVAEKMVEMTAEEIANWGSYYHGREGGRVDKSQVMGWMREAFKKLKEQCNAERRVQEG